MKTYMKIGLSPNSVKNTRRFSLRFSADLVSSNFHLILIFSGCYTIFTENETITFATDKKS